VDFQLPVGPVIKISPFDLVHNSFICSQIPNSSIVGTFLGISLKAIEYQFEST
jgi:hypothetical protein